MNTPTELGASTLSVSDHGYWQGIIELFGIEDVSVAAYGSSTVEIVAPLPRELRRGLRQAVLWCEPLSRRTRRVQCSAITWRVGHRLGDLAFAVPSPGALIELLVSRAELLAAREARRAGGAA